MVRNGFAVIPIILGIIVLIVLGAITIKMFSKHGVNLSSGDEFLQQYQESCDKNANPKFIQSPMALEHINYITPMGQTTDGHITPTDHVYVIPKGFDHISDNAYEIVMPSDGRVVEVDRMPSYYIGDNKGIKLPPDDFRLVISFNCRYFSIFIHVHKLADKLAQAALPLKSGENKNVKIDLKAGDLLANVTGFDWTMVDTETILPGFIHPSLYNREPWKIHSISPFDVYGGELKASLEDKSLRTAEPLGGKIDYDQSGKLIGNWFRQGTHGFEGVDRSREWDGHLSIAPDNVDPAAIIYSTGNWQGKAAQFVIKGEFRPETVTTSSGVVKLELIYRSYKQPNQMIERGMRVETTGQNAGIVLVQVLDGEKLKVEQFPGKTSSEVTGFTDQAQIYER